MNRHTNVAASATDLYYPRAWAYARESKASPALPQQLADLCAAARLEGYCLVGQSCDSTRRSRIRRPGRRALLRAVRNDQIDDVFMSRASPSSPANAAGCAAFWLLFQRKGVRVHTTEIDLRYDLYRHGLGKRPGGRLLHSCPMAEYSAISAPIQARNPIRRRAGNFAQPFGAAPDRPGQRPAGRCCSCRNLRRFAAVDLVVLVNG